MGILERVGNHTTIIIIFLPLRMYFYFKKYFEILSKMAFFVSSWLSQLLSLIQSYPEKHFPLTV